MMIVCMKAYMQVSYMCLLQPWPAQTFIKIALSLYNMNTRKVECEGDHENVASEGQLTESKAKLHQFHLKLIRNCNQKHDCTEICIKNQKKELEALESVCTASVPSCRFSFFRVLTSN